MPADPVSVPIARESTGVASLAQEALWFLDQTLPEPAVYNIPFAIRLAGPLRLEALRASLAALIGRYDILRVHFRWQDRTLVQHVAAELEVPLPLVELQHLPAEARRSRQDQLLLELARERFDLGRGPLLRTCLLRLGAEEHVLALVVHHSIFDGWSLHLLLEAWRELYRAACRGEAPVLASLATQYGDHARQQRERLRTADLERQRDYWRTHLAGAPELLELPSDRPRPRIQGHAGGRIPLHLPVAQTAALKALARAGRGTLFMALLTGFQVLLARLSGQEDLVVGTAVAGRPFAATWDQVGLFVNSLALRTDLSGDPSVAEALARVRASALGGFANQELPFEEVVKLLNPTRDAGHSPLYQVMFVMQNAAQPGATFLDLRESWIDVDPGLAMFDLNLSLQEAEDGLRGYLEYAAGLFSPASAQRMAGQYLQLLAGMAADPGQAIGALPLGPASGDRQPLAGEGAVRVLPAESLHAEILRQCARTPGACAATFRGRSLSYAELEQLSGQIAAGLQARGVGLGTPVGIYLDPCLEQLVGILGVLRAGGAYVPLDPRNPAERTRFAIEDTGMGWILADRASLDSLPAGEARALCLDLEALAAAGPAQPAELGLAAAPSCILYTSGSTGTPKGVLVSHRGMLNLLAFMQDLLEIGPGDRILGLTPITFDISGLERFLPLRAGAQVDLLDRATAANPFALMEAIDRLAPTLIQATPASWQLLAQAGWRAAPETRLLCGGEALTATLAEYLLGMGGPVWNVYGPTETTIWSTFHRVSAADLPEVPIGLPLWNTRVLILDARLQPVPAGITGEICLGGAGLAEGYLNRADLTRERFPADPARPGERIYRTGDLGRWREDGTLAYLGRIDHQVKVRGYRIELEEVEAVLARHPDVAQAVLDLREGAGGSRLVAFVVPRPDAVLGRLSLQAFLKEYLPAYMVPDQFVSTGALPLMSNGKVDRRAIHQRPLANSAGATPYLGPRDPGEWLLLGIWQELLGREDFGIMDDFFDLGGHSLLIVELLARIEQVFGRRLPAAALFEGTSIEALALAIPPRGEESAEQPWLRIQAGSGPALFFLHGDLPGWGLYCRTLAGQLGAERGLTVIHPHGVGGQGLATRIEAMAAEHLALIRTLQPCGPYLLGGYCNGALEALEIARQLRAQGERAAWVGMVAPPPPNLAGRDPAPDLAHLAEMTLLAPKVHRPALGAILAAVAHYDPPAYPAPVAVFLPEADAAESRQGMLAWGAHLPGLRAHSVPGDHVSCLANPGLGAAIRASLEDSALI